MVVHSKQQLSEQKIIDEFQNEIPTITPTDEFIRKYQQQQQQHGHTPVQFNLGIELLAGTLAGVTSCILFYPLECIEAKLQVLSGNKTQSSSIDKKKLFQPKTPIETARYIWRQEGIKGFYSGLTPTVLGSAVNWGIYFSIYRFANHWWSSTSDPQSPKWIGHSFSAIAAGLITTAIVNPFWVLKIRLATTPHKYPRGMGQCIQSILQNEGIGGLWKGVGISFLGVSEGLVQFVTYEYLLNRMRLQNATTDLQMSEYLYAGAMARLVAGLTTYPYLLIRSALQADASPYRSMNHAIKSIYKNEGIAGFYKGIAPNLLRSIPPAAFMLYIVEFFRSTLLNFI